MKTEHYIYPPRPSEAIPRKETDFLGEMGWYAQLKFNDTRCLIKHLPTGEIQLWGRHKTLLDYSCPQQLHNEIHETIAALGLEENQYHLLDAGLLHNKHKAIKNTLVIWDILVKNGTHQLGTTYNERYKELLPAAQDPWTYNHKALNYKFGLSITPNIFIPENHPPEHWPGLWDDIATINKIWEATAGPLLEGLVFKNPLGELTPGFGQKNNSNWLMRSRVKTGRHNF